MACVRETVNVLSLLDVLKCSQDATLPSSALQGLGILLFSKNR